MGDILGFSCVDSLVHVVAGNICVSFPLSVAEFFPEHVLKHLALK
jgi:hypothetical protein